jgi:hypothetical protein
VYALDDRLLCSALQRPHDDARALLRKEEARSARAAVAELDPLCRPRPWGDDRRHGPRWRLARHRHVADLPHLSLLVEDLLGIQHIVQQQGQVERVEALPCVAPARDEQLCRRARDATRLAR